MQKIVELNEMVISALPTRWLKAQRSYKVVREMVL